MTSHQDKELQEIMRILGNLEGEVREGFKGVHARQDVANGRTAKNESRIMSLELSRAEGTGASKTTNIYRTIIWSLVASAICGVGLWLFKIQI